MTANEALDKIGGLQVASKEILAASFLWSKFLVRFHYDKGEESFKSIHSMLGEGILENSLPYSRGRVWHIKAASGARVSVQITRSSAAPWKLKDLFEHREPCMWHKFPDEIDMELSLLDSHRDLGKAGSLWKCMKTAEDQQACFFSETGRELDLQVWLEDAVYPDETGSLMARCELELIWDNPPYLPIMKNITRNDVFFADTEKEEKSPLLHRSRPKVVNKGLATLGEFMNIQDRKVLKNQYFDASNPGEKAEADYLAQRWQRSAQQTTLNRFLARMITGRLRELGSNGLSGIVALIARLRSRDLWTERTYGWDVEAGKAINALYERTLELVRTDTPKAFLRDLILSEIIISWYWNRPLATV